MGKWELRHQRMFMTPTCPDKDRSSLGCFVQWWCPDGSAILLWKDGALVLTEIWELRCLPNRELASGQMFSCL